MGDSDGRIAVERDSVETMLAVLEKLRGIFNPDLAMLKENAPGIAAFAERMDSGATRLRVVLDNNSGATLSLPREVAETMVARFKTFRSNFNPDSAALQEIAPGVARFNKRLEDATAKLEQALQQ